MKIIGQNISSINILYFHFISLCFFLNFFISIKYLENIIFFKQYIKLPLLLGLISFILISSFKFLTKLFENTKLKLFQLLIIIIINIYLFHHDIDFIKQFIIFFVGINSILFVLINSINKTEFLDNILFIKILCIYISIIIFIGYIQYIFGFYDYSREIYVNPLLRINSFSIFSITYKDGVRNTEQLIYLLNSFLALFLLIKTKKNYFKILFVLSILSLFLAQSRAFYLAIICIIIFQYNYFINLIKSKIQIKYLYIIFGLLIIFFYKIIIQIICAIISIFAPDLARNISGYFGMGWTYSNDIRLQIYQDALSNISLFGSGFSKSINSLLRNNYDFINYESTIIEITVTMGLIFTIIYLLFYIYLFIKSLGAYNYCKYLFINYLFLIFVISSFDSQISSILYWFSLHVICLLITNEKIYIRNSFG